MSTINYLAKIKEAVLYLNTADENDENYQRIKECSQKYIEIFERYLYFVDKGIHCLDYLPD